MLTHPKLWAVNTSMLINTCKTLYVTSDIGKANARPSANARNIWKTPSPVIRQKWKTYKNLARRLLKKPRKKQNNWYKRPMPELRIPSVPLRKHRLKKKRLARHAKS